MAFLEGRIVIGFYESRIRIRFFGVGPEIVETETNIKRPDPVLVFWRVGSNFLQGRNRFFGASNPVYWRVGSCFLETCIRVF